jgi:hypothetical protein
MSTTATPTVPKATKRQAELISSKLDLELRIDELSAELAEIDEKLIKSIGVGNTVTTDEAQVTPTVQTQSVIKFEDLVEAAPYWARKVTKKSLDQAKFTMLRKAGVVPQNVLDLVKERTTKPFLRVTLRQSKEG